MDDEIVEREYLNNLHYAIFETTDIALAYKFAWVQRDTVSVKVGDNLETVDWQLDMILASMEILGDPDIYKISYTLTETDLSNGMKFLKTYNKLVLDAVYDTRLKKEQLGITKIESLSWDQQRKESEAYTADNTASTPLLTKLAEARGITIAQMVSKVTVALEKYYEKLAVLLAKKQKVENEIKACTTLLELHVVNAQRFGFYLNENRIIEAGYDIRTFNNATTDL
jgi:hypothetical protein